jgi:hypothetical protein
MRGFLPFVVIVAGVLSATAALAQTNAQTPSAKLGVPGDSAGRSNDPLMFTNEDLFPSLATGQRGVQVRTNVLSGKNLQAGPSIDYHPNALHPETPSIVTRHEQSAPVQLGGFVGYLFHDETTKSASSSVGLDLHFATDPLASTGGWQVQPGLDYSMPLASSWLLNTRLFSTYGAEGAGTSATGLERVPALRSGNSSDGFKDVGVGLGLGYSINDNWNIQTQARYQRVLGTGEPDGSKEVSPDQFFGGVMLDYKF